MLSLHHHYHQLLRPANGTCDAAAAAALNIIIRALEWFERGAESDLTSSYS